MYRHIAPKVIANLLLGALFLATSQNIRADQWQTVFNPYEVITLHLEIAPSDWDRVRFDQPSQNESWIPEIAEAWFWADGETPIRVTIRRKGESDIPLPSSADPQKVSLKIDVNEVVPGQKWRGLTKLSLENGSASPLNEGFSWLAHRLAWEAGVYGYEAAYAGWVKLYINGELKGVFVNAEQRCAQFLRNHGYYKETDTWLYKVDGTTTLDVGVNNSPAYLHLCYAPFNSGPGGGGGGCTQPDLEVDLPRWVDVRGLLTLGAVDAFLENRDALFSHGGKNSFAVDFNPPYPRTRLYFPWDLDTTIRDGTMSIYGTTSYQTNILRHPWFGQVYEQLLRDLLDGPFTVASLEAVLDRLQVTVGPAFDEDPYAYSSNSAGAFDSLRQWVRTRVPNVRGQLTQPFIPPPQFNQLGGEVVAGFNLVMTAPAGDILYTLDGTDPRAPGGAISASALPYWGPVIIEKTTHVIARAYDGVLWSALPTVGTFNIARYASPLRITEIMYHPRTQLVEGDDLGYEFLELKNTGTTPLDLSGFYFEGISFMFPANTVLAPGSFFVLARDAVAFSNRYPAVQVDGVYWGKLSDAGEKIRLRNSDGNTVISVEYKDAPPWPLGPDGFGYSLVLADANGDPDRPETWRASSAVDGSPGADDPPPPYGVGVVINEILAHTDPPFEDAIELYNPTGDPINIGGWFLSDDLTRTNPAASYDLKKYRIPDGTILAAGGYLAFYEHDFRDTNPGTPFALTEFGETVYLASADAAGNLTGYIIGAEFGATERGVAVGRYATSRGIDFVPLVHPTFGVEQPANLEDFRSGQGAPNAPPRVGPVVINEIMYNPTGGDCEFIELLSITNVALSLDGWRLAGAAFTFPTGTVLPAQGLVLLMDTNRMSPEQFRIRYEVPDTVQIFGGSFVLENDGELLAICKPNDTPLAPEIEIEHVRYNDKSPWPTEADGEGPSLERFIATEYGNDPINWRTSRAGGSPGRLNQFLSGIAIAKSSSWKYNPTGSDLGVAWRGLDYTDSGWSDGDGPLGYGSPGLVTIIPFGPDPAQKPMTVYFRKEFVVNDAVSVITNLHLEALYDDGFVLYLNGEEILRSPSMPAGAINVKTPAAGYNSVGYESFDLSAFIDRLRLGRNVLSVELHQESPASEDLLWDASLVYDVITRPTVSMPRIEPAGGTFVGPVQITLTASPADSEIYYTLDGTDPDTTSLRYTGPFILSASSTLKARGFQTGYNESGMASAVFTFFPPTQDSDGDGLPDWWEWSWFGNASSAQAMGDPDGDAFSNLAEFLANTNPRDASSRLRILSFRLLDSSTWQLEWSSASNVIYDIEWHEVLSPGATNSVTLLGSSLPATPPVNTYTGAVAGARGFLRVRTH